MRSNLSKATTGAMIAGAAIFVAACGGAATNNTANTAAGNGMEMTPEPMPMDNGMTAPPADNMTAPMPADNGMAPAGNMSGGNMSNGM